MHGAYRSFRATVLALGVVALAVLAAPAGADSDTATANPLLRLAQADCGSCLPSCDNQSDACMERCNTQHKASDSEALSTCLDNCQQMQQICVSQCNDLGC